MNKQQFLSSLFALCSTNEQKYEKIIELGRGLPPLDKKSKTFVYKVQGCQSELFLVTRYENNLLYFETASDSLIAAGISFLLTYLFSGETPETVVTTQLTFLQDLGILGILSPSRSNGLYSLHLKMRQDAAKYLLPSYK